MNDDVVARAEAALAEMRRTLQVRRPSLLERLVPELVEEVKRLRALRATSNALDEARVALALDLLGETNTEEE